MTVLFLLLASGFSVTEMLIITKNHMGFRVNDISPKTDPTRRHMREPTFEIDIPKH